jgi:hypothetical protein
MAAREATLRHELRLPATLIERTTASASKKQSSITKKPSGTTQRTPRRAPSTSHSQKRGSR